MSVHIEFTVPGKNGRSFNFDHLQAGRCEVFLINNDQTTVQVFPTRNGDDLDLWVPYFEKGTGAVVVVGWEATNKTSIWTASLNIQSSEGMKSDGWENTVVRFESSKLHSKTIPKWLGTENYPIQTVPLGAVCDQLNIAGLQLPPS